MKAIIGVTDFNRLIDSVKRFAAKSGKPIHFWIRLEFSAELKTVTAIAVDGYKMGVEVVNCFECDKDFAAYVKPDIKRINKSFEELTVELLDSQLLISYGDISIGYIQPEGEFLDWRQSYREICQTEVDYKIAFNGEHLLAALQSAKASASDDFRRTPIVLKFRGPVSPVAMETENGSFKIALPVRLKGE